MQVFLYPPTAGLPRTVRRWAARLLTLALPLLAAFTGQAQSLTNYVFTSTSGTFTPLSGATTATVPGTDDEATGVLPIGFSFNYNGLSYTTFSANTNGFMGLGGQVAALGTYANNLETGGGIRPVLAPLWDDLNLLSTSGISYQTTGIAGLRVLTVQWLNVKWSYAATGAVISFQAKLYETDGHVEFVYQQESTAVNQPSASIGITGVGTGAGSYLSLSDATTAPTASSTTETTTIATKPVTGQVYTFTPMGGSVAAPTAVTFSAITLTDATVSFIDNSANEYNFAVIVTPTAGGTSTTTIVPSTTTAGTGTMYSANLSGLSANTGYTVQVRALGLGRISAAASGTFTTLSGTSLSGTYYVGTGTSPQPTRTYATLTAAAAAYTTGTLTGPVTFLLLDNAYGAAETFPITFGVNSSASATNTLTVKPNAGVTNAAITASGANDALVLSGADYIILDGANTAGGTTRDLTVATTNTNGAVAVRLVSLGLGAGATNNVIRNLNIAGPSLNAGIGIMAGGATAGSDGPDNDNLTIQNNSITSCYTGLVLLGSTSISAGGNDGLVITGNTLGGAASGAANLGNIGVIITNAVGLSFTLNTVQRVTGSGLQIGLTLTGSTGATISQNTFQNITSATNNAIGILLATGTTGATVTRNRVLNIFSGGPNGYGGKGIDVQTGTANSNVLIANNFVQITASSGYTLPTDASIGIRLGSGGTLGGVSVYYNSVSLTGTDVFATRATQTAALYVGSSTSALDVRNNIFRNEVVNSASAGAKAYAIYSDAANSAFTQLNYNDYFVSGAQGVLGYLGTDLATLAALRTATGKDANSLSVDPQFASTTDLHTNAAPLNNTGTPIAAVTVDIDGDTRSATTPDIGADEFTSVGIDLAAGGLVAPVAPGSAGGCYGPAEAVTVSIRNDGGTALNFATTPATITVVVTGPTGVATQTLPFTLNTGTLASGATLSVPLGAANTVNLAVAGTYSFAITATVAGDANAANNTLTPSPPITVGAPVAGTLTAATTSLCGSGSTALTLSGALNGSIQLQSGSSATGPFTNVTGATSATYTTPVLNSTIYYRAQVTCGTNVASSNVLAVLVSNPLVATTNTPLAICAGTTATLTATANAGATVRFFTAATGGTALSPTTAGSYTTPVLTANTTYYTEAYTSSTAALGPLTNAIGTGGQSTAAQYLTFDVSQASTLLGVNVYPATPGNVVVELRSSAGAVLQTATVAVSAAQVNTKTLIPLNFALPVGTGLRLGLGAGSVSAYRNDAGAAYPYSSQTVSITGNSFDPTYYYWFYDWSVSSECVGATRTAIQVNVSPAPVAGFSYGPGNVTLCTSQTTAATPTLATGATAGTFTSATGLTINATTGAIIPSTSTPGTYTITNTVPASGSCAATTATSTVTITTAPQATFSYATTGFVCAGSAVAVAPTLAAGASAGVFTSTTGLTINATTGAITPSTSTAGTYVVTNTVAATGTCGTATATASVTISPAPATPTVTVTSPSATTTLLTSSVAPAGATYQWFLNAVAIAGATSQTYTVNGPTAAGAYSLCLTFTATGCSSCSAVTTITAARQTLAGASLRLFPNPTADGRVSVELSGYAKAVQLTVLDALGRVVLTQQVAAGQAQARLDLSGQASGVYLLRATTEGGTDVRRIVRQ